MLILDSVEVLLEPTVEMNEEVLRNARVILTTFEGSVPFDRKFGVSSDILDLPINEAKDLYTVECITKLRTYEPRATVRTVSFNLDTDGNLYPKGVLFIESE